MCEVIVLFDGYSINLEDGTMKTNCSCTLIKTSKNIIVDTMTAWDREKIIRALNQHNLTPEEIDYVVCTHSHADHIGNNNLFLNAEHIVGTSVHRGEMFYDKNLKNEIYEICPEVKVMATPGHTAEDVTVVVESTVPGKSTCFAITGDLFEKEEDILNPSIWKELGDQELQANQSQWRSFIVEVADFIIPGHGPMFRVTEDMKVIVKDQEIKVY
ncbi:PREDICTED: metallo-beta-lactamase domain-containing protein 1 [Dufourea novaeangliae]|uniref:Metallo-beta-lactamase domain-containing protein 1 n=1 Tax=Dufourea novaeangliae TaxID=178035 RepID=A0A154P1Z5_DUFNO|nr:PREDICTED: metallo-beta-lactamase domain-containing protein 1 [Dufourea novaeangliae]KZC05150.1 Metallo-beta-lactamase domain-containing protein 1 [Dufourea novaeangliae]